VHGLSECIERRSIVMVVTVPCVIFGITAIMLYRFWEGKRCLLLQAVGTAPEIELKSTHNMAISFWGHDARSLAHTLIFTIQAIPRCMT
jgi:hypothetical protein